MSVTANQTFIACGTNFLQPSCQYRLVSQCTMLVGVAAYHVILLQISNLSLVTKHTSIAFCPTQADVETAFVEFSELVVT